eukprot:2500275-Amphidinium_carterae.1
MTSNLWRSRLILCDCVEYQVSSSSKETRIVLLILKRSRTSARKGWCKEVYMADNTYTLQFCTNRNSH